MLHELDATSAAIFGAMACGAGVTWAMLILRLISARPVAAYEPRRPVPWTAGELLLVMIAFVGLHAAGIELLRNVGDLDLRSPTLPSATRTMAQLLLGSLASLLTAGAAVLIMFGRTTATWLDLGIDRARVRDDVMLGIGAFFTVALAVFAIQITLSRWVPYEHPILEVRSEHNLSSLAVATLLVVLIAPVVEEFFFRVLLQGWLEAVAEDIAARRGDAVPAGLAAMPVVGSSLLFALSHWGHGAAPVALFFFGLALGYVYRQTHRILPSIVIHALLNSISMIMLWSETLRGL